MRIQQEGVTLHITLEPCCAIMFVEEHTALVQQTFAEASDFNRVVMDCSDIEEIDTAYLQLLLVIRAETLRRGASFSPVGVTAPLRDIMSCYGINTTGK